jgi:predicted lipid-binding transport protein (Tim44 family)
MRRLRELGRLLSSPRVLAALAVLAIVAMVALDAFASGRPGGGQTFNGSPRSGGGGGGGGSSGGGGGFALWLIFSLLPWPLKLLVVIGIIVFAIMRSRSQKNMRDWSSGGAAPPASYGQDVYSGGYQAPPRPRVSPRATLAGLRDVDPTFSLVLFEDFLYALYAEAHQRRAAGQLDMLTAYIADDVIARMKNEPREPIQGLVIGAMSYVDASILGDGPNATARVDVELEVNLTVETPRGPASSYLVERWTLVRRAGAKTRPQDKARIFDCPSCGAPQTAVMAGKCTHCNQAVSTGEFGWVVKGAQVLRSEPRPPLLTTEVAEEGNDLPTIYAPDARARLDALWQKDQAFAWPQFEQRVNLIFTEFQTAWSNRDLAKMRPFLSDNLFQTQQYWVEAYKAQHLRNITENARIERMELARVESDASFDAITVRFWGVSTDYTVNDEGKVVVGSKTRERRYSEYWTLIRGSGRKGPTKTEPVCPNCGAPLAINQVGTCTYCQAKVTSGEFDWVLSRIEQDEAYTG